MDYYNFGDLTIGFEEMPFSLAPSPALEVFRSPRPADPEAVFSVRGTWQDMTQFADAKAHRLNGAKLLTTDQGQFLVNYWGICINPYGYWLRELECSDHRTVCFNPLLTNEYPLTKLQVLLTVGLHRVFLQRDAAVVHASYIDIGGEAILFTAPSGTGKSTQAELWRKFAGAEVINGDRAIVRKRDGIWHVFGTPCSGSSGICLNRTLPLRAIVVLAQHTENVVERMTYPAKIRALVSATEVYPWLQKDIDMAFGIAEQIVSQVPVIRLRCRPDLGAVECLRNFLEENR